MANRRRTSKGILVASTNPQKQSAIIASIRGLHNAHKQYNILCPALLIAMQSYLLNT